jgi:hypothetical protein
MHPPPPHRPSIPFAPARLSLYLALAAALLGLLLGQALASEDPAAPPFKGSHAAQPA